MRMVVLQEVGIDDFVVGFEEGVVDIGGGDDESGEGGRGVVLLLVLEDDYLF